jgi:hypothetical protein
MNVCFWVGEIANDRRVMSLGWAFGVGCHSRDTLWFSATLGDVDSIQRYYLNHVHTFHMRRTRISIFALSFHFIILFT